MCEGLDFDIESVMQWGRELGIEGEGVGRKWKREKGGGGGKWSIPGRIMGTATADRASMSRV